MSRRVIGKRPAWLNPDNSYDLLLPFDYAVGDQQQKLARLQLKRLTGVELLILDQSFGFAEKLLQLIESQTGLLRVITSRIDAVDLDRIDDIFGYFREPGSVTGATS